MRTRWPASPALRRATVRAEALTGWARSIAGRRRTSSTCSTGKSSRNQPTAPRRARTSPTALTTRCVTSPAASKVMPRAVIIGQAVGAGTSIISCDGFRSSSADMIFLRNPPRPRFRKLPFGGHQINLAVQPLEAGPILRPSIFGLLHLSHIGLQDLIAATNAWLPAHNQRLYRHQAGLKDCAGSCETRAQLGNGLPLILSPL